MFLLVLYFCKVRGHLRTIHIKIITALGDRFFMSILPDPSSTFTIAAIKTKDKYDISCLARTELELLQRINFKRRCVEESKLKVQVLSI
jgi:hypothetical protein